MNRAIFYPSDYYMALVIFYKTYYILNAANEKQGKIKASISP